ncbi:hypothetical protein [Aliikangiella sp. IMCC44359]|uniref:hypothetical protein n=1 Tax=Aliikangiella sp. IMCC44359 TaxID=3459125 RepID=UPI00403A9D1D
MKLIFLISIIAISNTVFASDNIECLFTKFHLANHANTTMNGYAKVNQSLSIVKLKTAPETLKLDGSKRATNSSYWVKLIKNNFDATTTSFVGDFADILTIEHELGENGKGLNGWYSASLVSSNVSTTTTNIGKCLIKNT